MIGRELNREKENKNEMPLCSIHAGEIIAASESYICPAAGKYSGH